jgi:hypothetical protein
MKNLCNFPPNRKGSIIKCECGFEIPILPDPQAVGRTIDAHIEEHRKKYKDPTQGENAARRIHDFLFKSFFEKIAEM